MLINNVDATLCNNHLPIVSAGGLELPPKVCALPVNHAGPHADNCGAVWLDIAGHMRSLERRGEAI